MQHTGMDRDARRGRNGAIVCRDSDFFHAPMVRPARGLLKSLAGRIGRSGYAESSGCDGVEELGHGLVGPILRIVFNLRVSARARCRVDALAFAEVVPKLLDLGGTNVVGAAALVFRHHRPQSSSSLRGFTPGGGASLRRSQPYRNIPPSPASATPRKTTSHIRESSNPAALP